MCIYGDKNGAKPFSTRISAVQFCPKIASKPYTPPHLYNFIEIIFTYILFSKPHNALQGSLLLPFGIFFCIQNLTVQECSVKGGSVWIEKTALFKASAVGIFRKDNAGTVKPFALVRNEE